jgi:hypothetical protein
LINIFSAEFIVFLEYLIFIAEYNLTDMKKLSFFIYLVFISLVPQCTTAQDTQIRGFIEFLTSYVDKKVYFGIGEQDLFITSSLSDRISFLGETVFKFDPFSSTNFAVSVERAIIYYNIQGNNDLMVGKIHTPVNYWNDTYHHGRVFFPTIFRPLLFSSEIVPLHTVGLGFKGHDLGDVRFGYEVFVGNGLGSSEIKDNDKYKSFTGAIHIKPGDKFRLGMSFYNDVISKGAEVEGKPMFWKVNQHIYTASVSRFAKKFEMIAEGTLAINHTDTTGSRQTFASYIYAGYRLKNKIVPYVRFDNLHYQEGEIFYNKNNATAIVAGIRYELNYLAVVKIEYQHQHSELLNNTNQVTAQFAIGF